MDKLEFMFDNIPRPFYKENDGNLYKILQPIAKELDDFVINLDKINDSRFIDTATEEHLNRLGQLINVRRFNNETDESFRGRIKSHIPSFIGGGSISAIKQVVNNYLGVEPIIIEHYKEGENHPYFDNGVLKGLNISENSNLNINYEGGTYYILGNRITINSGNVDLIDNTTNYIALNQNGEISVINIEPTELEEEIIIASVITSSNTIQTINDLRFMLNSEIHYITNTASITVQIPYSFDESKISLEDTKDVLRNTKAAGVALLIKVMETYREIIEVKENINMQFIIGFSGIGSNNFLGGK